ncbi:MAG: AAA-like domain-containing protein [Atopobiaceae bacterium]|nr:AAA-like domain-containing protein [Atopobiaceae bacterium]
MVDVSSRVAQMRVMVERGNYFCMNRARQYGKTTSLAALERALAGDYTVVSLDFQGLSHADFATEGAFASAFAQTLLDRHEGDLPEATSDALEDFADRDSDSHSLRRLFRALRRWLGASQRPVVLIIDEVDSATNNQVFLDFLAQLRLQYLDRAKNPSSPAFRSVVLAGVTDVKHLKNKIRPNGEHTTNSPWNIAADFDVVMSFDATDVAGMLTTYDADHASGMDVDAVAEEVVAWTGGYPFLVSRVCQLVDKHALGWNRDGVDAAVRVLLKDDDVSLFESLTDKLEVYPVLKEQLRSMPMRGEQITYLPYDETQKQLRIYGFATERGGRLVIANRIFESLLYDQFIGEKRSGDDGFFRAGDLGRNLFVDDGRLDMCAVLEGFRRTYVEVYGPPEKSNRFAERDGRELFLMYLKPIINGTGNYCVEAQTRDQTRTDVIVDYAGERFVVELKVWRGPRYNEAGERQVAGYLEHFGLDVGHLERERQVAGYLEHFGLGVGHLERERQVAGYLEHFGLGVGYMLSFSFNQRKEPGLRRVTVGDKILWEETV